MFRFEMFHGLLNRYLLLTYGYSYSIRDVRVDDHYSKGDSRLRFMEIVFGFVCVLRVFFRSFLVMHVGKSVVEIGRDGLLENCI